MSRNWNPFFALENTRSEIDLVIGSRLDVEDISLSEDELEVIGLVIEDSLSNQCEIVVDYIKDKRIHNVVGVVSKVDMFTRCVTLSGCAVNFKSIIAAKYV